MIRLVGLVVATLVIAGLGVLAALHLYDAPGPLHEARAVLVPRGGVDVLGALLQREGVVSSATAFELAVMLTRNQGPLKSAELEFPAEANLRTVLAVLRAGRPVQHRLTIPEGRTAAQVADLVASAPAMEGDTPVAEEGSLLPETYAYELGSTRAALVDRARSAMDRTLAAAWASRTPASAPLASPREALILASIVERETSHAEERPRVAAVFLNRLRRGMKLQSDPTVVYGASGGLGTLDHGITRAELGREDPYNTYRIDGLPPGPICMPGAAAIKAVTQPWTSEELYFVADGSGGHTFAKTEAEHARNVARYREFERQRTPPPAPPPASRGVLDQGTPAAPEGRR